MRFNPKQKLTIAKVKEIKQMILAGMKNAEIAAKYKMSIAQISSIRNERSWGHIQLEDSKCLI